jgi:branched-chain amino acid transport system substrate-binding protein
MYRSSASTHRRAAIVLGAVLATGAAACSSSGTTSTAGTSGATATGGANKTVTVGILTDATGPAASANKTSIDGVKAGTYYAARNGYTIKYVIGDTATNPTTTLQVAQKLVTQDHVDAVIAVSAVTQLASTYLTSRGIPVVGAGEDGDEWITSKNMFSVFGALNSTKLATTFGLILKQLGATNLGSLGYGISPGSAENAKGNAASAEAAGLTVGYLNAQFPFGSTNVAPVAIAMKNGGVDSFTASTDPNTAFSLITALKNEGVKLKASVLATGYGTDLLQAGAGALAAAQNVYFVMTWEPFDMNTAATKQMSGDLKSAGFATTQATYAQYAGYTSVGLLVRALDGAGSNPSHAAIISSLSKITDWNSMGLFGSLKVNINDRSSFVSGPNNCFWLMRLEGKDFKPVAGALPTCGTVIPGKTVSAGS